MIKRKLEEKLLIWKNRDVHKPLIVRGARQVGKTSLIRDFGKIYFDNVVEINLEKQNHKAMFEGVMSVEDLEKRINLGLNQTITPGQTLIFIDEIQESQRMLELLRFIAEERPFWHVLVAGSLLEVKLQNDWNIPVGRVEYKHLYPLTFFEYLEGMGNTSLVKELMGLGMNQEIVYKQLVEDEFKQYILLGGMPELVADFSKNHDFGRAREILTRIQSTYIEDIGKYLKSEQERKYLELVVSEGPRLAGTIFNYEGFAGSSYRSREMSEAMRKIEKTMLCAQLPAVNSTVLPIVYKYRRPKKLIWLDAGLVNLVSNTYPELIRGEYGGKLMEQLVGQTLVAMMESGLTKIAYFAKDREVGSAEVDFCFPWEGKLVAMEVKSGVSLSSKSLTQVIKEGQGRVVPIRISWGKLMIKNGILNLPVYLVERWSDFVGENWGE